MAKTYWWEKTPEYKREKAEEAKNDLALLELLVKRAKASKDKPLLVMCGISELVNMGKESKKGGNKYRDEARRDSLFVDIICDTLELLAADETLRQLD